jgi:hypothetical protein
MLECRFVDLKGLDRSRLVALMQRHQGELIDIDGQYFRAKTWLENARHARQLKRLLARSPNSEALPTLDDFLWNINQTDASRGEFIPTTIEAYCAACRPLFAISTEVHLVDRFFHLRRASGQLDRSKSDLLRALLVSAVEFSGQRRTVFLHFELPRDGQISESEYERQVKCDLASVRSGLEIDIHFDIHDKMLHGRYMFSVKGGLQFDHGFYLNRSATNHVHWLSTGELVPIKRTFGLAS